MDSVYMVQTLLTGLANGAIYGLVALGFVLLVNAVNIINFAQGEFVMLGAFLAYTFGAVLSLPFWAAFLLVLASSALIGVLFERTAYRPLRQADGPTYLVATMAASVAIRNIAQNIWGSVPFAYDEPFGRRVIALGSYILVPQHLFILGVTLVLVALLWLFFFHTRLGKLMRAAAQDRDAARLLGVPVRRIGTYTFMLAGATGGMAGILVAPVYFVNLDMGFIMGLKAFVAAIIGGWGSIPGALLGGLLLGLAEQMGTAYISSAYKDAFAFLVLIGFLLFLPRGLFGERVAEKA